MIPMTEDTIPSPKLKVRRNRKLQEREILDADLLVSSTTHAMDDLLMIRAPSQNDRRILSDIWGSKMKTSYEQPERVLPAVILGKPNKTRPSVSLLQQTEEIATPAKKRSRKLSHRKKEKDWSIDLSSMTFVPSNRKDAHVFRNQTPTHSSSSMDGDSGFATPTSETTNVENGQKEEILSLPESNSATEQDNKIMKSNTKDQVAESNESLLLSDKRVDDSMIKHPVVVIVRDEALEKKISDTQEEEEDDKEDDEDRDQSREENDKEEQYRDDEQQSTAASSPTSSIYDTEPKNQDSDSSCTFHSDDLYVADCVDSTAIGKQLEQARVEEQMADSSINDVGPKADIEMKEHTLSINTSPILPLTEVLEPPYKNPVPEEAPSVHSVVPENNNSNVEPETKDRHSDLIGPPSLIAASETAMAYDKLLDSDSELEDAGVYLPFGDEDEDAKTEKDSHQDVYDAIFDILSKPATKVTTPEATLVNLETMNQEKKTSSRRLARLKRTKALDWIEDGQSDTAKRSKHIGNNRKRKLKEKLEQPFIIKKRIKSCWLVLE